LRSDFVAFFGAAFSILEPGQTLEPTWHHEAIAKKLMDSNGRRTREYIAAPPRSLKSLLVSVAWVAFKLGHEPGHKFICASYSGDLSKHLAAQCRKLMQSEFYRRLFATRLDKATDDVLVTTVGGFRIATSVGATVTGYGGDTLISDDPLSATEAYSLTARKALIAWFTGTFMSRLNNKRAGTVFVVGQRLHEGDLIGYLIDKGWSGLTLPAIAPRDMVIPLTDRVLPPVGRTHFWKKGEPLQAREPLLVLEDLKRDMTPTMFAAQYLLDPVPETGNRLDPDWLKWYEQRLVRLPEDQVVQSWDTAVKATAGADYSVCLTFLVRNNNEYYLIDDWRKKVDFPGLQDAVLHKIAEFQPAAILIEEHASGQPLIDQCRAKGMSNIIGRRPTKDKVTRMITETTKLRAGCLILPKAAPWLDEFMIEYLAFDGGKYDDQIDALSQFLNWRTEVESRPALFEFDFGDGSPAGVDTRLAAPSPEELLWRFGR
jgi:predicted phage terminase large subunit-like protein